MEGVGLAADSAARGQCVSASKQDTMRHGINVCERVKRACLDVLVETEILGQGTPREAVGVVSRHVPRDAEGVGARLFQERVGGEVVVAVGDAREHDLGVVAEVGAVVDVSTKVGRRVRVEGEEVVGRRALVARVVVVVVFADPDDHVALVDSGALEDDVGVVQVRDDLVDVARAVPI